MVVQKIRITFTLLFALITHDILSMNQTTIPNATTQRQTTQVLDAELPADRPVIAPRIGYAYPHKRSIPPQKNNATETVSPESEQSISSSPAAQTQPVENQVIKPRHPAQLETQTHSTQVNCQGRHQSCTSDEPKNLELAKRKVKKYYEHDYIKDVTCLVDQIKHYIDTHATLSKNDAVVFDVDDTVISSFDYAISTNLGHSTKSYHEWELHPKRPIPPMLDLYNFIINKGIKVFFVTGRSQLRRKVTEDNLRSAGFTHWEKLYLRPQNDDNFSVAPYKTNVRRDIESQGYRIIANIGDQESDLIGGFADKTFKMPNPMYTLY